MLPSWICVFLCKHVQRRTFIMVNNDIPYMDWQSSNLAETFKLFKQRLDLYFVVNKIKIEQLVNYILLRVGNEGLKKYNTWLLMEEEKRTPEIIFNKFIEQLEPKEKIRINRLKSITYKMEAEESLDNFVSRYRRMTEMFVNRTWATATYNRTHCHQYSHCRLPKGVTKKRKNSNPGWNC